MGTKVFLSLSYVDRDFVRRVRAKLPSGVAYFYEESFENGEVLIKAMERAAKESAVFVLFASRAGQSSPWVQFEIDQARLQHIQNPDHRILVFPTDRSISISELPSWLRQHWIPKAGWLPGDVARYITKVLLDPNFGISAVAPQVVGRGRTLDRLQQIVADHIQRTRNSPTVYFLTGFRGVGRRTFASYYMRTALAADVNLPYGPVFPLSAQADLADIHRALRSEISPSMEEDQITKESDAFNALDVTGQIEEVVRLMEHFFALGQAVTLITTVGFFEDRGDLKEWVLPLFGAIPVGACLFAVSSRQINFGELANQPNTVQMRVEELTDKDVRTLMVFTAKRQGLSDFTISDELVRAIGGHADIANAAVRLAALKGVHILERDPRQLLNIQNTILGESIESLTAIERDILYLLSWVPTLSGGLLETTLISVGHKVDDVIAAIEGLLLGCLVVSIGAGYAISPAIRFMFRRMNVTPPPLLKALSGALLTEWKSAKEIGQFRIDLFETFVFMHSLEGAALPKELVSLLTPGMLFDVVKETYARGKDEADKDALERVIGWGKIAEQMKMSEATREEILSITTRASIRLGNFADAEKLIEFMARRSYRSVPFLQGHLYRRQENFPKAIEFLTEAVRIDKINRSAVHELALAYKKSGKLNDLRQLLKARGDLINDSAMFAEFQIGIDLARGDLSAAEAGIERLRLMPDDDGRSHIREAQLLMKRKQHRRAKDILGMLVASNGGNTLRLRSLRAMAAAGDGDFELAQRDIEFVKKFPSWQGAGDRLAATVLIEQKLPKKAQEILDGLSRKSPEDWILYARALETEAEMPETPTDKRDSLKSRAAELRVQYNFALEYDFGD